jgi:DNA-binding NarL/FixJ family response regulator
MKKIRIDLIEDNRLMREGIATTLDGQPDFRVVAAFGGNHGNRGTWAKSPSALADRFAVFLMLLSTNSKRGRNSSKGP